MANKKRLAAYVKHHLNIDVDVNTLFDIQACDVDGFVMFFLSLITNAR